MARAKKHVVCIVDHPTRATHWGESANTRIDRCDSIVGVAALGFADHNVFAHLRALDGNTAGGIILARDQLNDHHVAIEVGAGVVPLRQTLRVKNLLRAIK